ncbi:hypothetical protein GGR16_003170 [Chelatococcus caeni]|uniref:2-amino-thiazoline-4-carboxylic acid hydrolase n=1 Tax=Chelatococcus caeni TaxID=1348468 RepID=A0A840C5E5_9HYPH|nr:hypothetical protein [Chelatococcus caeni]
MASAKDTTAKHTAVTDTAAPPLMPMIERRRIEAEILKHVYETLKESHGVAMAQKAVADAVRRSSIEQGARFAAMQNGETSIEGFAALQPLWTMENALEIDVIEKTETTFAFNVTRCRYAEMYRQMGLGEIGHLLSCQRDGTFCEGYDDKLKLARSQTIMQGASHCDFRYTYEKAES